MQHISPVHGPFSFHPPFAMRRQTFLRSVTDSIFHSILSYFRTAFYACAVTFSRHFRSLQNHLSSQEFISSSIRLSIGSNLVDHNFSCLSFCCNMRRELSESAFNEFSSYPTLSVHTLTFWHPCKSRHGAVHAKLCRHHRGGCYHRQPVLAAFDFSGLLAAIQQIFARTS